MWLRIREYYKSSFRLNLSVLDIFKAYSGGVIPFISFSSLEKYIAHFAPIHKCPNRQTNLCNVSPMQQIFSIWWMYGMEAKLKILYLPKLSWVGYYNFTMPRKVPLQLYWRWKVDIHVRASLAPPAPSGAASSVCQLNGTQGGQRRAAQQINIKRILGQSAIWEWLM